MAKRMMVRSVPNELTRYPFAAVVAQQPFKLALMLVAVNPLVGGVLVSGPRGSAKSTLAKGLVDILPGDAHHNRPFVSLPLGASEEMLIGTLNLQQVLEHKKRVFQPGLLAKADKGLLYVDEVNLLGDNLVDQLLDVAASGVNIVERDGVSHTHQSRFILLGTMNPEEGDLRPQLSDRFGLCVHLSGEHNVDERIEIVKLRERFDRDPQLFIQAYKADQALLQNKIQQAQARLLQTHCPDYCRTLIAQRCSDARVDGLRADIVWVQAALAMAALDSRVDVCADDVAAVEDLVLAHRRNEPSPPRHNKAEPPQSHPPQARSDNSKKPEVNLTNTHTDKDSGEQHNDGDWGAMAPVLQRCVAVPETSFPVAGRRFNRSKVASLEPVKNTLTGSAKGRRTTSLSSARVNWFTSLVKAAGQWPMDKLCYYPAGSGASIIHLVLLDTSGSVLANEGFARAKGLIMQLVDQAYTARELLMIVGFGNQRVHTLVAARRAPKAVKSLLDGLKAGGGTPLRDALDWARRAQSQCDKRHRAAQFKNYIFTDGRVSSLAFENSLQGQTWVVDLEQSAVKRGKAQQIAQALNAHYLPLMAQ